MTGRTESHNNHNNNSGIHAMSVQLTQQWNYIPINSEVLAYTSINHTENIMG
jgi:hypothetical protein